MHLSLMFRPIIAAELFSGALSGHPCDVQVSAGGNHTHAGAGGATPNSGQPPSKMTPSATPTTVLC